MSTVTDAVSSNQGMTPVSATTSKKTLGKDDFMKLLMAQLKNQDPTSPMDAKDFGAQMAQFSSVEQLYNVNQNLEKLQTAQTALSSSSAVNLIGKTIDSQGNAINLEKGKTPALSYSLPKDAEQVLINISDSSGRPITTLTEGQKPAGKYQAIWSGINGDGNTAEPGKYTFTVKAVGSDGNEMLANVYSSGIVSDVVFESGKSYAIVNGNKIPAAEISRVGLN